MKKLLFIVAIAAFGFTTVNAQEVSYGAKAGVNFASIWGDDNDEAGIRTSFHVGAVVEIAFSEKFSLQPELVYSSQGYINEQVEDSEKLTVTLKSNY